MPNTWRIGRLTIAGVILGVCLLAFCSGILAVGKIGMNLEVEALRTLAFIVLVFGSQAMIYAIRERRHLWGSRPSLLLVASSVTDIAIASTLAVAGIAMTPIPGMLVGGTLAASVIFAIVVDLIKVPVFARLGIAQDPRHRPATQSTSAVVTASAIPVTAPAAGKPKAADSKPEAEAVVPGIGEKADAKPAPKPKSGADPKSEPIIGSSPEAITESRVEHNSTRPVDLTTRIEKRAYELYQQGGRKDGAAVQNWEEAESEIQKGLAKAESPGDSKPQPVPEVSPQLVQRVHELYEQLGRQDVRTVEDWEKAQGEIRKEQPAK
jgi:hypothetical protein